MNNAAPQIPEEEFEHITLTEDVVNDVVMGLQGDDSPQVQEACEGLRCEDKAELLNQLNTAQREQLVEILGDELTDNVLPALDADAAEDVLRALGAEKTAEKLSNLEVDDAVYVLKEFSSAEQQTILSGMNAEVRRDIEQSFTYPEASAGRIMQKRVVSVPEFWSVGQVIDFMREQNQDDLPEHFYVIYVTNHRFHPVGVLALSQLMRCNRDTRVSDLMNTDIHPHHTDDDQEDVAFVFRKYGLVEAPVVNTQGRLVGTITVDDVVSVIQEEDEEDFLKSAGLQSQDVYDTLFESVKQRFPWLFVNLLTAIAASAVIDLYEDTIQQLVLLAVLMPIIASMGGNAGIQSATIAVRALATKKLAKGNAKYMIRKEVMLGLLNGIGLATITGLGILLIYQQLDIAIIFATATIITMIVAGLSGAGLPFLLQKLGIDPAIASGVFLTMLTDMFGFLAFLGLASFMLL